MAPIHDAVLVEGPEWEIDDAVAETQEAMAEASAVILDGFRLRSDAKIVRWPGSLHGRSGPGVLGPSDGAGSGRGWSQIDGPIPQLFFKT